MTPSFKNDNNVWYLNEIFLERATDKSKIVYTLKDNEHNGYPSLYEAYMACNDPTEYSFAVEHLGGWAHWKSLQACSWFEPYLTRWREELHVRSKSLALSKIMITAQGTSKEALTAQKYLIEKGYDKSPSAPRGRPSKDQIAGAARTIAENTRRVDDDLERLRMN